MSRRNRENRKRKKKARNARRGRPDRAPPPAAHDPGGPPTHLLLHQDQREELVRMSSRGAITLIPQDRPLAMYAARGEEWEMLAACVVPPQKEPGGLYLLMGRLRNVLTDERFPCRILLHSPEAPEHEVVDRARQTYFKIGSEGYGILQLHTIEMAEQTPQEFTDKLQRLPEVVPGWETNVRSEPVPEELR